VTLGRGLATLFAGISSSLQLAQKAGSLDYILQHTSRTRSLFRLIDTSQQIWGFLADFTYSNCSCMCAMTDTE